MNTFSSWLTEALAQNPMASARALKAWMETNKPETFWKEKDEAAISDAFETADKLASEMQTKIDNPDERQLQVLKDYEAKKGFALHWFSILQGLRDIVAVGDTVDTAVQDLAKMLQASEFVEWQSDEKQPKESIFKKTFSNQELMDIYLKNKQEDGTSKIAIPCSMAGKMTVLFKDGKVESVKIK